MPSRQPRDCWRRLRTKQTKGDTSRRTISVCGDGPRFGPRQSLAVFTPLSNFSRTDHFRISTSGYRLDGQCTAGLQLGALWEQQTTSVRLTGNLAGQEGRVLVLTGTVGKFPPVRLAFAWTQANTIPIILGQINFLLEFDVCFFRARSLFEIKPKS